jgi:hypothetical protein
MAGSLNVATVDSTVSNTPTVFKANGTQVGTLCRAWIYFGYDGATTTNYVSFNVSSVSRTATGNYTINFTNALPDANYATALASGSFSSAVGLGIGVTMPSTTGTPTDKTVSSLSVTVATNIAYDSNAISVAIFR